MLEAATFFVFFSGYLLGARKVTSELPLSKGVAKCNVPGI